MIDRPSAGDPTQANVKPHLLQVADAIRTLLASYSTEDQKKIISELRDERDAADKSPPRPGSVFEAILRIIPRDRTWTVDELKRSFQENKVEATSKEIYNAIGYLTRRGRVKRIGYGRYMVDGVEFVTSDDFGGENTRHEDEYRTDQQYTLFDRR